MDEFIRQTNFLYSSNNNAQDLNYNLSIYLQKIIRLDTKDIIKIISKNYINTVVFRILFIILGEIYAVR